MTALSIAPTPIPPSLPHSCSARTPTLALWLEWWCEEYFGREMCPWCAASGRQLLSRERETKQNTKPIKIYSHAIRITYMFKMHKFYNIRWSQWNSTSLCFMGPMSTSVGGPLHNSMIYNFIMLEGYDYEACEFHWNNYICKIGRIWNRMANYPTFQVVSRWARFFLPISVKVMSPLFLLIERNCVISGDEETFKAQFDQELF